MNNTINRIKKRADTLAEYIVGRVEWLEKEKRHLEQLSREEDVSLYETRARLMEYTMPLNKTLNNIEGISKNWDGTIYIRAKKGFYGEFYTDSPLYPLIEKLLKEYEARGECLKAVNKTKNSRMLGE